MFNGQFENNRKLKYLYIHKKAQLTPGLRATALSFQDGGSSKMAVNHHLGYYRTGNSAIRSPTPKTLA